MCQHDFMSATPPTIIRARLSDVPRVAPLFARYREFYEQPYDEGVAERFLTERLEHDQAIVLMAESGGRVVGFTQLFPGFSSIAAAPSWLLGDLFVLDTERGRGVARALLAAAEDSAASAGAVSIVLETARSNDRARRLYESVGYREDDVYLTYEKPLE